MITLSSPQQRMLADIAAKLPAEKQRTFRERVEAMLTQRMHRGRFGDDEVMVVGEFVLASLLAHRSAV